jgi:hypothetical protein
VTVADCADMACRYCGLPTDGGANHGASSECVAALAREAERILKKLATTVHLPKPSVHDPSLDVEQSPADTPRENQS